jgi:hypothetical protein
VINDIGGPKSSKYDDDDDKWMTKGEHNYSSHIAICIHLQYIPYNICATAKCVLKRKKEETEKNVTQKFVMFITLYKKNFQIGRAHVW